MDILIWIGAAVSLIGVGMLLYCIIMTFRARKAGLEDDVLREKLKKMVVLNFAALLVSAMGLMAVIAGILLS
ncbi:MAG: hypothetical protein ACPGNV_09685 [Mangrovicoccus sp.]